MFSLSQVLVSFRLAFLDCKLMFFYLLQLDKDQGNSLAVYDSSNKSKEKTADQKVIF